MLKVCISRGKHSARTAGLITHGKDLLIVKNVIASFGNEKGDAQLNDVTAGVELSGIHILIEPTDQVFKNITHLDAVIGGWIKVQFGECLHNGI